jgi:hypothetical protein
MSEFQRLSRSHAKPGRSGGPTRDVTAATPAHAGPAPQWAANHVPVPFALGGVQRKVTIGPAGDSYEREADRVASDVASGRSIAPSAISPIGSAGAVGQRATAGGKKPEQDRKPEQEKKPEQDKKADREKKDQIPAMPVQKAAAPAGAPAAPPDKERKKEKTKDEKPKSAPIQKAGAPAAAAVPKDKDKQPAKDKKKEEKPKSPSPVQKAPAASAAQAPSTPKEKEKEKNKTTEQKLASAPVQRATAPAGPAAASRDKEKDKKKEEKPKPAPVQKAAAPTAPAGKEKGSEKDKKKEEKPKPVPGPVQKAGAVPGAAPPKDKEKKKEEKPKAPAVQKADAKADDKKREEPPKPLQRAAGGSAPTPSMESSASRAIQSKGAGEPINPPTRRVLEPRMGVDLGGVRVHEGHSAHETADAISARAFTHGNDIWLGRGQSQSDVPLMAHEAAHVVQRADPPAAQGADNWDFESPLGRIKKEGEDKKLSIPVLKVPAFKKEFIPSPLTLPKKEDVEERTDKQRDIWEKEAASKKAIEDKLETKLKVPNAPDVKDKGEPIFFLIPLKAENFYLIGTREQLKQRSLRPYWDKEGVPKGFQVDHRQEVQLTQAGEDPDRIDNLWLLEAGANMASGRNIKTERDDRIRALLTAASKTKPKGKKGKEPEPPPAKPDEKPGKSAPIFETPPDVKEVKNKYEIKFEKVEPGLDPKGDPPHWTIDDIRDNSLQVDKLKTLTSKEIKSKNLQGNSDELVIYTSETGGAARRVKDWKAAKKGAKWSYGKRAFQVENVEYDETSKTGKISGTAYKGSNILDEATVSFDIREMPAVNFGGYIPRSDVQSKVKNALSAKVASPIEMDNIELTDRGFFGRGRLAPTIPLIRDAQIDVVLNGDDVYLSRVFSAGDFKFPGPVKVTSASLEIYAGTKVGVKGDVNFEIERVGRGTISGKGELASGFAIEGQFFFDSEFFQPADVKVWYRGEGDVFGGEGNLGIPEGKVKGIKSALLKVKVENETINATGTVKPSIPGIEQGDLSFSYDPKTGVVIAGKLELKKDIPGIEGGSVLAELAKRPGEEKWKLKAGGEATPKIPGVSAKLAVSYDDGAFDAVVMAGYEKGMLKGAILVGATNRPVGEDGKPAGPPPEKGDKVTLYGGGSLTLKIAPWLQATAGIKLLPNGEIEVTGEIGLPAALEIFKEKKLDKNIFKVGIDIPIVGVSVLGQRIGIFANISGGLDLSAGIGPAELNQLKLAVTYNPAHEENTNVVGDANLHIPAHAGLRLFVRGSLGVGIPIVSASAGLEFGGSLGLEGALDAGVHVEWTPTKGLDLTAAAGIYVEPKLKFDITGFVLVEADLLFSTIELYSKRWQLAAFEYGSGLKFGLKFPIHYQEGHPFDISLSDVEFEVPKIEPGSLLEGLIKRIA